MADKTQEAYLIYPRLGGLANDLLVQPENGPVLYHVQAKLFAPLGRTYSITDDATKELFVARQDHTVVFPAYTVFQSEHPVASVGQLGVIPQNYFIEIKNHLRLTVRIPVFGGIFSLDGPNGPVAQIAQHRTKWIVAIDTDQDRGMIIPLLAVIYREYSIGG